MTSPLISVILPVYNGERHLVEAIESVLVQTYEPFELLIVDDGSTDASADIAGRYVSARVHVLRQSNAGTSAARNTGIDAARGELLAHLDADDVWLPDSLALLAGALAADESADVVCGRVEEFFSPELEERERRRLRALREPLTAYVATAMLLHRNAHHRVGPYDVSLQAGQDLDWLLRASEVGLCFTEIADVVVRRRLHKRNKGRVHPELAVVRCRILKHALDRRRAVADREERR